MTTTLIVAATVSDRIEQYGAWAGFAAVLGLGVLALLYTAQAREVKRLREWAGRAPERAAEDEARVSAEAQRRVVAQPIQPRPAAEPATPAAQAAAGAAPTGTPAPATPGGNGQQTATGAKPGDAVKPGEAAKPGAPAPAAPGAAGAKPEEASKPSDAAKPADAAKPDDDDAKPDAAKPGEAAKPGVPAPAAAVAAAAKPGEAAKPGAAPKPALPSPAPAAAAAKDAASGVAATGAPPPATVDQPTQITAPPVPAGSPPAQPLRASRPSATPPRRTPPRGPGAGGDSPLRSSAGIVIGLVLLIVVGIVIATALFGGDDEPQRANSIRPPAPEVTTPDGTTTTASPLRRGDITVAVLNGTTTTGLARGVANRIERAGFKIGQVTNAVDQSRSATIVQFSGGQRQAALEVARLIGVGTDAVQALDRGTRLHAGPEALVVATVGADQNTTQQP